MIAAIIVEYNPLHNGHIYHINETRRILNQIAPQEKNYIVAIMSGGFTQRGDIAILNKYTRARHAILAGVDMVIELPTVYATSSAEFFANGAMQIASKIKNLGLICFGAECEDTKTLEEIAQITTSKEYNEGMKSYLQRGLSYPLASEETLKNLTKIDTKIASSPNNILGIEYIKQAKKLNLKTKLISIKRVGSGYNEDKLDENFNSARSIRSAIEQQNFDFESLKVPRFVYEDIVNTTVDYDKLYAIVASKCLECKSVYEDNEGVINRVKKYSQIAKNYEELVNLTHTKRYTKSKIKRILLHIALDHTIEDINADYKPNILAVKEESKCLLSQIDFTGDLSTQTKIDYADKIYNIVSNDKITNKSFLIIK